MTAEQEGAAGSVGHTLVLYDGVCGLCNRLVSFLLRRDSHDRFRFAPLQSEVGRAILRKYGLHPDALDTVVVVSNFGLPAEHARTRSQAVLDAVGRLGGIWKLTSAAKIIPLPARDAVYRVIARHRSRVFGEQTECSAPQPEDRAKFLSGDS